MTEYLVRRFVKDYEDIGREEVRTRYGILSSIVGILCNVLLFGIKLLIGMLMHSIAVMADAFNNLSDAASSVISFVGVKMAGKPADKEHPFGHGRMEYIAAFIVAFLVIQVGFSFFKSSAGKLMHPEAITFQLVPFLILVLSVGVKLWMGLFNRKLGKRINSKVMLATSADSMGDAVTTSATLISILICRFAGVNIDAAAGLLVSLMVMWAGISIAKETLEPLIGEAADPELYKKISEMVEAYDGILGTHDLIVHNYGPNKSMASIHAEVPNDCDVEFSHEIIDRIEREALRRFRLLLVIHMDPVETHNELVVKFKDMVADVLENIDSRLEFHDFRMVDGQARINLIFDLVVPWEYKQSVQGKLKARISDEVKKRDGRCECVITVENSFMSGNKE